MNTQHREFEQMLTRQVSLPYLEYLPTGYPEEGDGTGWPLVIFLHGFGQRGTNLDQVNRHGPTELAKAGHEFPFVLVAPQCPVFSFWDRQSDELELLLRHCLDTYSIDSSRVYMTGLSMGGFGTWHFAASHPHALAAIVPICGGGDRRIDYPGRIRSIAHLPVWAFHGDADQTVPVEMTRQLVAELESVGAADVQMTIYPGVGHDSWTQTYDTPEVYEWMLSKRNPGFSL